MILDQNSLSMDLALLLARDLVTVRGLTDAGLLSRSSTRYKEGVLQTLYVGITAIRPAMLAYHWSDATVIVIDGSSSLQHIIRYKDDLSRDIDHFRLGGANRALVDDAVSYMDSLDQIASWRTTRVVVAGHSYGAAVAEVFSVLLHREYPNISITCMTFGAPRPGPLAFADLCRGIDMQRFMLERDPVPNIPPKHTDTPTYFLGLDQLTANNYDRYTQPANGTVLNYDGSISALDTPLLTGGILPLLQWLASAETQSGIVQHSATAYYDWISGYLTARRRPVLPENERTHTNGVPLIVDRRELDRSRHQALVEVQQALIGTRNISTLIPPTLRFRSVKVGLTWVVKFGEDTTVAVGPTKRKCGSVVRTGNAWLKRLQRIGSVNVQALTSAFEEYLQAAADTTGQFRPPMNTL